MEGALRCSTGNHRHKHTHSLEGPYMVYPTEAPPHTLKHIHKHSTNKNSKTTPHTHCELFSPKQFTHYQARKHTKTKTDTLTEQTHKHTRIQHYTHYFLRSKRPIKTKVKNKQFTRSLTKLKYQAPKNTIGPSWTRIPHEYV